MDDPLAAFISARLSEDEAMAKIIGAGGFPAPTWITEPSRSGSWMVLREPDDATPIGYISVGRNEHEHIARHDPARVLREVAARRAIVARYVEPFAGLGLGDQLQLSQERQGLWFAVRELAATWSDHPDYRAEWAPDHG